MERRFWDIVEHSQRGLGKGKTEIVPPGHEQSQLSLGLFCRATTLNFVVGEWAARISDQRTQQRGCHHEDQR